MPGLGRVMYFSVRVAQSQHTRRNSVAVIVFISPRQLYGDAMFIEPKSIGRDGQLLQLFRAVARQCAKRTTFIIMLACLGFAASAQISGNLRGGESTDASAMEETTGGGKRAAAELALSDEQRGRIYEAVMRIPNASIADEPAPAEIGRASGRERGKTQACARDAHR